MKTVKIIVRFSLIVIPVIFYLILMKIIPDIRGNAPQAQEIPLIRLLLVFILYTIEYIIMFMIYIFKTIMSFEDNKELKWLNLAHMVKFLIFLIAGACMVRYIFIEFTTIAYGDNLLYGYVVVACVIETILTIYEKHECG